MSESIAEAFIEIRARDGGIHDDVERIGKESGAKGGDAAGKTFSEKFTESSTKGVGSPAAQGKFSDAGGRQGTTFADGFTKNADSRLRQDSGKLAAALAGPASFLGIGKAAGDAAAQVAAETASRLEKFSGALKQAGLDEEAAVLAVDRARQKLAQLRETKDADPFDLRQADIAYRQADARVAKVREQIQSIRGDIEKAGSGSGGAGVAAGDRFGKGFSEGAGKAITVGLKSIAGPALGAGALHTLGVTVAGSVTAVKQLAGSLLLLPAAGAAAAVTVGTLKIGTQGLGDAFSALASGNSDKFVKSLSKLTPEAQQAVTAVSHLTPAVSNLRKAVQSRLFAGIGPEIADLGGKYLPVAASGFGKTAEAVNRAGLTLADFLGHTRPLRQTADIFDHTSEAAGNLRQTLPSLTDVLLTVAQAGSTFLPEGAKSFDEAAQHLAASVDHLAKTGQLKDYIGGGLDAAKALVTVLGNAGKIISEVFAAGGSGNDAPLQTLADLLGSVADEIGRPEFQAGLGDVFAAIAYAAHQVDGALPDVADALVALAPAIGHLVAGSGEAFAQILKAIAATAQALAPILNVVAGVLDHLGPGVGQVVVGLIGLKAGLGILTGLGKASTKLAALDLAFARITNSSKTAGSAVGGFGSAVSGLALTTALTTNIPANNKFSDDSLAQLVQSGDAKKAADQYALVTRASKDLGQSSADLAAKFPKYQASLKGAGAAAAEAAPKLAGFDQGIGDAASIVKIADNSLRSLTTTTIGYASAILSAQGDQSAFEQAIDDASAAAKRNGKTLDLSTQKGRDNATALRAIANAGIAYAKDVPAGADAQAYFNTTLERTRVNLIKTARSMGDTTAQATAFATSILGIPNRRVEIQGNIKDLKSKIADAEKRLTSKDLTDPQKSKIRGDIADLKAKLRTAEAALAKATRPRDVNITAHLSGLDAVRSAIGSTAPGARAAGGPVRKGTTYLVGEKGPELFTAAATGTILTAGATKKALAGSGDVSAIVAGRNSTSAGPAASGLSEAAVTRIATAAAKAAVADNRPVRVYLDSGELIGAINRQGGQRL